MLNRDWVAKLDRAGSVDLEAKLDHVAVLFNITRAELNRTVITENPFYIQYIEQTPELCLIAVKNDGLTLWDIKEQTMEICLEAIENQPRAVFLIKDKSLEEVIRLSYSLQDRDLPEDTENNLRGEFVRSYRKDAHIIFSSDYRKNRE